MFWSKEIVGHLKFWKLFFSQIRKLRPWGNGTLSNTLTEHYRGFLTNPTVGMPCIARHCLLKAKRSQLINTAAAERCQAKQQLIKPYINHCIINNCIQFIDNKPIVKNLCVNLLVSKKDFVVRSDSQRSEPYTYKWLLCILTSECVLAHVFSWLELIKKCLKIPKRGLYRDKIY